MLQPGDVISYHEMCANEDGATLQRGMNFKLAGGASVILMSVRRGAPYQDKVEDDGRVLIYEGHDVQRNHSDNPKSEDQPMTFPSGLPTQNGRFFAAASEYKKRKIAPELVRVYEKIKDGIWVYNGVFELVDAWLENTKHRNVFKFKLLVSDSTTDERKKQETELKDLVHNRMIPTSVKLEVWKRDKGQCIKCGRKDNLHFDHILPYAKGGTSLKTANIQLLCARHNLEKSDRIE
jgi:hypothetical protein